VGKRGFRSEHNVSGELVTEEAAERLESGHHVAALRAGKESSTEKGSDSKKKKSDRISKKGVVEELVRNPVLGRGIYLV